MTMRIECTNGSHKGVIVDNGKGDHKEYGVLIGTTAKWFKTIKGAEKFMANQGYARV